MVLHIQTHQQKERMGALRFSLALLLFLSSSPVRAQWWSFIWATPKSKPTPSPLSASSPSITSPWPSDIPVTTKWVGKKDGRIKEKTPESSAPATPRTPHPPVSVPGNGKATPGATPPDENTGGNGSGNGNGNGRSQYKPLKHWKSGECNNRR